MSQPSRHGGHRTPANPASVSGPGRLSRRTDGRQPNLTPTGMDYGDARDLHAQEAVAPMPQDSAPATPNIPDQDPAQTAPPAQFQGAALMDPTQRPDEPITHGVDTGPGGGSDVMPLQAQPAFQAQGPMTQMLAQLAANDPSGRLSQLYQNALASGA